MLRSAWAKGVCGVIVLYLVVFGVFQSIEGTSRSFARWKALVHGEIGYFLWQQGTPEYERKRIRPVAERDWEYWGRTEAERVQLRRTIEGEILDKKRWTLGTWLEALEANAKLKLSLSAASAAEVEDAVQRYFDFITREE